MACSLDAAELLGLYSFEGSAPDALDDYYGYANPVSTPTNVSLASGYEGQAASFSGTGSIELPINISPGINPNLTIGGWFKPSSTGNRAAFGHDNGGWDRGATLAGGNWRIPGSQNWDSGIPVDTSDWQFVAVAYSGNTSAKLYVDTDTYTKAPHNAGGGRPSLAVGAYNHVGTWNYQGLVDNFFVINDTLSDSDIATIRSGGLDALKAWDPTPQLPLRLKETWDFESGDLVGWNVVASGVPGDNLVFTTENNQPTARPFVGYSGETVQGDYFIRTWEGEELGNSDAHTGVIETDPFVLGLGASFSLLVGGGNHPFSGDPDTIPSNVTAVNLERLVAPDDWEMIFTATGWNANFLHHVAWDASAFSGETVRLRIYDTHTSGWGHIAVDNILYSVIPEPTTLLIWSLLAGLGVGLGWRRRKR
jgi:hypothetical protein